MQPAAKTTGARQFRGKLFRSHIDAGRVRSHIEDNGRGGRVEAEHDVET